MNQNLWDSKDGRLAIWNENVNFSKGIFPSIPPNLKMNFLGERRDFR